MMTRQTRRPLTRRELDRMQRETPTGCHPLVLLAGCHDEVGTVVSYLDGVLRLHCPVCAREFANVAVLETREALVAH